ncbi:MULTISPECIES: hypothetical protein [Amycolatopsis]|uniref:Uncharacterized protein n=2 Tax=Amycolatopsis TaxID=1813 RepID=A0A1I3TQU4_9PSEU|nr:hypothetical protein [Amycolatopsis sacchari]SFJ72970.1 hypothetical protein SAMN05421835_1089 [Amycolatopsis sacchari]
MDEKELRALFRAAPGEPPPPGFTLGDVTAASARATARRRSAVLLTVACLVVVLGAAGIAGVSYFRSTTSGPAQPVAAPERPPQTFPVPSSLQGSGGNGKDGPRAEGTSGCEKVDRELATALAGELPATGVTGPSPGPLCPTATRSVGFHVTDGDRSGFVSVTLSPAGMAMRLPSLRDGSIPVEQRTASGGTLVVLSTPDPGSAPPLETRLPGIALALSSSF